MTMSLNKAGFRAFYISITASEHELHDKFVSIVNMLSGQWTQDGLSSFPQEKCLPVKRAYKDNAAKLPTKLFRTQIN